MHYCFRRRPSLQHSSPLNLLSRGDADGPAPLRILGIMIPENSPLIKIVRLIARIIQVYKHPITRTLSSPETASEHYYTSSSCHSCDTFLRVEHTRRSVVILFKCWTVLNLSRSHDSPSMHLLPSFKGLRQLRSGVIVYLGCVGFVGYGAQGCKSINSTRLRFWIGWIESFVSRESS